MKKRYEIVRAFISIDKEGLYMFRRRRAPSMEELKALEEMDKAARPRRRNELIDESEPKINYTQQEIYAEEEEPEEQSKKDHKTRKLIRSRFLLSIQVGACLVILVAVVGIRLIGGSVYDTVKRWYIGSINESILVNVTKDDLLEIFGKNTSSTSNTEVTQTGALVQANKLMVTYGKNQEGPVTLSVLLKSPVANGTVTSAFGEREGEFHQGVDIAASADTPITASLTGTVEEVNENVSYGKYVLLDHGSGIKTKYAHCSEITVKQGDFVKVGEMIAKVGSTGESTGPHVHLELLINGVPYDPQMVLQQ